MKRPKALWTQAFPAQVDRRKKKKAADRKAEYRLIREWYLTLIPWCERCGKPSQEVHHTKGKLGTLLADERFFMATCRACHTWIHEHPKEARLQGWLCEKGDWNKEVPCAASEIV